MINKLKYSKFKINLSWLLFDKIFRASANIFLSIFLARNLGPENFGILNYFLAFLFLFSSISAFGINPVLVNQILKTKKNIKYNSIISAYYFRFILSLINYIIFLLLIGILNENQIYNKYSLIIGLGIIFKSCEVFFSYFEAKSLSKYIVLSQLIGFVFSAGLIVFVIIYNLDIFLVYQALALDFIIVFFLINFFYYKKTKFFFVKFDYNALKKLIKKSFPVLVSSLGIILYMRIDQIMIKEMIGEYSLGIYSVSVRYIEIFHFIPKILMISLLPILLTSRKYIFELQKLNSFITKISIALILLLIFTSDIIITLIFSDIYDESILLTKILSLTIIFVFLGVVNEHWYILNNLQKYYAINVFTGAIINILLNYFFILKFGVIGASYATIITYFYIIFIFEYFNKKTRFLLKIKIKSITQI